MTKMPPKTFKEATALKEINEDMDYAIIVTPGSGGVMAFQANGRRWLVVRGADNYFYKIRA